MRAERLLTLLLLLQSKGRMTAQELSLELGVSQRTIYRDIEALSMAGIAVYTERGRDGGCSLLDTFRGSLTGFTEDEVIALSTFSIPSPLKDLGLSQELNMALSKLSAVLSTNKRYEAEIGHQRIYLDSTPWFQAQEDVPHLQTIQQAVWEGRQLQISYRFPLRFETWVDHQVEPYGLVAKTNVWYLVASREAIIHAYRISRIREAQILKESVYRVPGFDLARFWQSWCAGIEENRPFFPVKVRVSPEIYPFLRGRMTGNNGEMLIDENPVDEYGWLTITLAFESLEEARAILLGYGRSVEVLKPEALKLSVIDYARQIVDLYTT